MRYATDGIVAHVPCSITQSGWALLSLTTPTVLVHVIRVKNHMNHNES